MRTYSLIPVEVGRDVSSGWLRNGVRPGRMWRCGLQLLAALISGAVLLSVGGASSMANSVGTTASKAKSPCGGSATVPLARRAPYHTPQALDFNFKSFSINLVRIASAEIPPFKGIVCMESPPPVPSDVAYWSPNGMSFALSLSEAAGTAEIGTARPFSLHTVRLGAGVRVVGLTDSYLIGSSWRTGRDELYPLEPSVGVGTPTVWGAARDTWQEWVPLPRGLPALETGGYVRGSLSLTQEAGAPSALGGGEMYLSPDRRYGAVLVGPREPWTDSLVGLSELQPANAGSAISIWYLDGRHGPRRVAVLHLPLTASQARAQLLIQGVAFSPDDRYVAIQPMDLGSAATAPTYIFTVGGRLVGRAPYGNGFAWLPESNGLWLDTPDPEGQGRDVIVDVHGRTITAWPDAAGETVLPLTSATTLAVRGGVIGRIADGRFTALQGLPTGVGVVWSRWSPNGQAAILEVQATGEVTLWLLRSAGHPSGTG